MKQPVKKPTKSEQAAFNAVTTSYYHPNKDRSNRTSSNRTEAPKLPEQKPRPMRQLKGWFTVFFVMAFLAVMSIVIWDGINFSRASAKIFGTPNIFGALLPSPLALDSNGRVNILLVGYSADDAGHAGAELTDSIMIMSIDRQAKTGYTLSIPRDLLVDIPDYATAKINEAYQAGEQAGYPSGGMGLLSEVVEEHFGINIHYHTLINYAAVRETVDALGGVTVTIESDDPRGLYDPNFQPHEGGPLKLANGTHTIDGATALKLTRARGAAGNGYGFAQSDFVRTKHQQMVIGAILDKTSWKLLLDPRTNGAIFQAVAQNVETDVNLPEVLPLGKLLLDTPPTALKSVSLRDMDGENLLAGYRTRSGQDALIPRAGLRDFSEIQAAIATLR